MRRTLIAASIALLNAPNVFAAQFGGTVFFGDSLSDSGYFSPALPPGTGRFTTNPGPVWAENLAADYGRTATPNYLPGGTDYAQGGARVTQTPGYGAPPATGADPIHVQIGNYLTAAGAANPNALYSVWAGANDIFNAIDPSLTPDPNNALPQTVAAAQQLVGEIARLKAAGARYVVVPNLPDIGKTPFGLSLPPANAAGISQLVSLYNGTLYGGLKAAGIQVIPADIWTLFNEATANPARFGFVNVTAPACTGVPSSVVCTSANLTTPTAASTYLFADDVHPTTAGHRMISDYVYSLIEAPSVIGLLAEAPIKTRATLVDTIRTQAEVGRRDARPSGSRFWASAGAGRLNFDSNATTAGASGNPYDLTVGADVRVSPGWVIGATVSRAHYGADYGNSRGSFEANETGFSLYGAYADGPVHAELVGNWGSLDFDSQRRIVIGSSTRTATGSPQGSNTSLALSGGFDLAVGDLRHGPTVGFVAQKVIVDGFSESGGGAAGLAFDRNERQSRVVSVGYRIRAEAGRCRPFASVAWNHEMESGERSIGASLLSTSAPGYSMPVAIPDRDFGTLSLGAAFDLGGAQTALVSLGSLFAQTGVRQYGLMLGYNLGF